MEKIKFLLIASLVCIMGTLKCNSQSISIADSLALVDLYNSTNGPNWTISTNWLKPNVPAHNWWGVYVRPDGTIWRIHLTQNNLSGSIPDSFGELTELEEVNFWKNNLTGSIPNTFGQLTNLIELRMDENQLSGSIPNQINQLANLVSLELDSNQLSGNIPNTINQLSNLEVLNLTNNQISGNIPTSIGQLSNLRILNLGQNNLTGSIPSSLGLLTNVTTLSIFQNQISGTLPSEIGNMTSLNILSLGNNTISGSIPSSLMLLSNLSIFFIGNNQLSGDIPTNIDQLSNLNILDLSNNQFTGSIPSSINNIQGLSLLNLSDNLLSGPIPSQLDQLQFFRLRLTNNEFVFSDFETNHLNYLNLSEYFINPQAKVDQEQTLSVAENGTITLTSTDLTSPNNSYQWFKDGVAIAGATNKDLVISNATSGDAGVYYFEATNSVVTGLTLTRNNVTLSVDIDTCGVSATEKQALLDLYNATNGDSWTNTLAGNQPWDTSIPVCDWYGVTVTNGKILNINLRNNNLIGTIPSSIGDITTLEFLQLDSNSLSGSIPTSIGNLINLKQLRLHSNSLTGSIPPSLGNLSSMTLLNLGLNNLTGSIPGSLGNLSSITSFILSNNNLTGNIPSELGQLSNLTRLYLYNNQLTGSIPPELGQLSILTYLYLYNNQLTGSIPPELGQLASLRELYLYINQLTGQIPIELGQLTSLDRLSLYANQLSGSIPVQLGQLTNLEYLQLYGNQLSGNIPVELTQLNKLTLLYLYDNQLSGQIPDFSILPLSFLQFRNNKFVFGDFENQHIAYESNINSYTFSPQAEINEEESYSICVEESLVLNTTTSGSQNHYLWFKDGVAIAGAPDSPSYLIQSATLADAGIYHCEVTNDIVTGLTLVRRPIEVTLSSLVEDTHNTITNRSYDIDGAQKAAGKSFYDGMGQLQQTQTWNILTDETWASQVMRDAFYRSALQTLSAPIASGSQFNFLEGFVTKTNQTEYLPADYQDPTNPAPVGNGVNTLGWYYSESNTDNPYQDVTSYPFTRTIFSTLNPGKLLASIGGNKVDTNNNGIIDTNDFWAQSYSFSMPATDELSLGIAFGDVAYQNIQTIKTVYRDVHGIENVVFTDTDGKVLAAARSGNEENPTLPKYNVTSEIGEQGYVDVHLPVGCSGISLSGGPTGGGFYRIDIYDLVTEEEIPGPLSTLPSGLYRIAVGAGVYDGSEPYLLDYDVNYYDFSLNEYDDADRLVKSYQPLGDTKATKLFTEYRYNTQGQLVYTNSPDEGEAWFKYRMDGQIRFSQNSKQQTAGEFSYTHYDTYGRPVESGVFIEDASFSFNPTTSNALDAIIEATYTLDAIQNDTDDFPNANCKEQQFTTYDIADDAAFAAALGPRSVDYPSQTFVAGNIAHTANENGETWYSYDIYGRVKWLVQEIQGLGTKTIDYEYHPITGLVTKVLYQRGVSGEQFIHRYSYNDADQLTRVEVSMDNSSYTTHADYEYYDTGALKRTELGNGAQGLDYVYNLAGQLKSINHPSLDALNDPGGDNNDLFGLALDYHNGDYRRTNAPTPVGTFSGGIDQYNGNIKSSRWNNTYLPIFGGEYRYSYDYNRNNWLTGADFQASGSATGSVDDNLASTTEVLDGESVELKATNSVTLLPGFHAQSGSDLRVFITTENTIIDYGEDDYDVSNITYDANGNIMTLQRNKDGNEVMDNLQYSYTNGTNQLSHVDDIAGAVAGANDLADQAANNYTYNGIGQLVNNASENIDYFYNASGLVTQVDKDGQPVVKFFYNDRNHRVKKESYSGGILQSTTYYLRDVVGQVMAIYSDLSGSMVLAEQPIYGAGRIGVYYSPPSGGQGDTVYELADHLGNVRVVFSKNGNDAQLQGNTDYYPFGMSMPGRNSVDANQYRYGYQGQYAENDSETGKPSFELRLWDARIGRWLSPDPYGQFHSPYLGMGNNPITYVDPDGGCIKNGEPCDASRIGERVVGDGGAVWEWDGETWGLHESYAVQLEGVTMTQNGEYSYRDWQSDIQDFRAAQLAQMTAEHQREFNEGRRAYGAGVAKIIGVGLLPIAAAEGIPYLASRGLMSVSTEGAISRVGYEAGSEFLSNGGNAGDMNVLSIGASVFSSNLGAELIGSRYSLSLNGGFETYNLTDTAINLTIGRINMQTHSGLKSLTGSFDSGAIRGMRTGFTLASQSGLKALNSYEFGF